MILYLCEKPQQGEDIANFLGMTPADKKRGYYQKDQVAVAWARGHLFKLQPPEYYEPAIKGKWDIAKLPIIPERYEYILDVKAKSLFRTIKNLLKRTKKVFIATDPDQEGECIARNIIKFAGYKGEVCRVLYGATDKKTLSRAFDNPLPGEDTEWMYQSALARAQSDWVVGMNLTMAMSLVVKKLGSSGRFKKAFPIGRVKTPAAMMVYLREKAIREFKPVKYYEVEVVVSGSDVSGSDVSGPGVSGPGASGSSVSEPAGDQFSLRCSIPKNMLENGRLVNKSVADKVVEYLKSQKQGEIVSVSEKEKTKQPPLPFELTTLQSECDKYAISPDETLEIAQSLYDKPLSSTTYPRTNIPYLAEGLTEDIEDTVGHLLKIDELKKMQSDLDLSRRTKAWNDKKIKVHHGIIPTSNKIMFSRLTPKQKVVYILIARRYLLQFLPEYVYEHTEIKVSFGKLTCEAVCNVPKRLGWRAVEQIEEETTPTLPKLTKGQVLEIIDVRIMEKKTRKPPRYTQASLAKGMEKIASEIEDPELKKILDAKDGIGTIATRPAIIKDLVKSGLLVEKKRQLQPSRWFEKYMSHIPESMKQPGNSALWERGFIAIRDGQINREKFVGFQIKFVEEAVARLALVYSGIK